MNISMVILTFPLIHEAQLPVSGERMYTIVVNRLEDQACPVKVWLGKLTALDMTLMDQHKQANKRYLGLLTWWYRTLTYNNYSETNKCVWSSGYSHSYLVDTRVFGLLRC